MPPALRHAAADMLRCFCRHATLDIATSCYREGDAVDAFLPMVTLSKMIACCRSALLCHFCRYDAYER